MNLQEASKELNIDYDVAMTRFGNSEAMYIRFLNKFLHDNTYNELTQVWEEENYEEIERKAHTLKGVSANLCLGNLYSTSDSLVQKIRNKDYTEIETIYQNLQEEYNRAITVITNIN